MRKTANVLILENNHLSPTETGRLNRDRVVKGNFGVCLKFGFGIWDFWTPPPYTPLEIARWEISSRDTNEYLAWQWSWLTKTCEQMNMDRQMDMENFPASMYVTINGLAQILHTWTKLILCKSCLSMLLISTQLLNLKPKDKYTMYP